MSAKGRKRADAPPTVDPCAGAPWVLHHADCLDPVRGLASLADRSVDHVISDPPYGERTHHNHRVGSTAAYAGYTASPSRAKEIGFDPLTSEQMRGLAEQFARVARRWSIVFCEIEQTGAWQSEMIRAGLDYVRTGAWVKPGSTPQFSGDRPAVGFEAIVISHTKGRKRWNGGGKHGVWTIPIVKHQVEERLHTTQKPLDLMRELVSDFTDPGDIILDPFAGSGTTGVAAIQLGRRFIGWERDANYHAIAMRRLRGDEAKPNPAQPSLFGGSP